MGPCVSVIIPTYNCARYLPQAVESVLAQTYPAAAIDLIVIDDGSTDDTEQAMLRYASRMRYIKQLNAGTGASRNAGVRTAAGEYVALLDADDYWFPDRLASMVDLAVRAPGSMVMSDYLVLNEETGVVSPHGNCAAKGLVPLFALPAPKQYEEALEANFLVYMCMFPREVFARVGLFDDSLTYGEDWDLQLRCLQSGIPVRLVQQPLAVYRHLRPGATTTRHDVGMADSRLRVLQKHRRSVSSRRWNTARGMREHYALEYALAQRQYVPAAISAARLASNWTYARHWLRQRHA
ncbi:MAG: glycosyltransferase family 2 protein [Candidatus Eremiobacteraeota bacterium]|nr:glycosyltransferase family 2 protein [Candidatus Eremiobacteraeota bacterium]